MKPWKTQRDADWDGVSLGWVKQRTQYCQVCQLTELPAPLRATPTRKRGKALSRMASRKSRVTDQSSHSRKQQTARPHSVHCWLSHQRPVRMGLHCQAGGDYHPWRQCSLYGLSIQLDNGGGSSHPCRPLGCLKRWQSDYTRHHRHRLDSVTLLQNVKSRMGSPVWTVSMVDTHLRKLPWVYCLWHTGVEENDRADSLVGTATLTSCLLLGESEVLRNLRLRSGHRTVDRFEERGMERGSARDLPWKDEREPSWIRRTLELFQRRRLGNFWVTGWSAYGFSDYINIIFNGTELNWRYAFSLIYATCTFFFKWRICILRPWNTRHAQSRRAFLLLLLLLLLLLSEGTSLSS